MANLQTKRGCPHTCAYCTYPVLEGNRFRARNPKAVVEDLRRMRIDHGVESVFFTDSVFNDAQGHYLAVAEEILRELPGLRWYGFFRPQGMGRPELSLLKRAGLGAVELGTDGASDTALGGLGKGFSFADVEAVNEACAEERIPAAHFVMFGGPEETDGSVSEGLKNLERLRHSVVFAFSGIRILPGTRLHQRAVRDGLVAEDDSLLKPRYYYSPGLNPEAMNARIEEAFRGRRDRIFPPSEGQQRLSVMQRFGYRGLLWDRLVRFPAPVGEPGIPKGEVGEG